MKNMNEETTKVTAQQLVEAIKDRPKNDQLEAKTGVDLVGLTEKLTKKLVDRRKNKMK